MEYVELEAEAISKAKDAWRVDYNASRKGWDITGPRVMHHRSSKEAADEYLHTLRVGFVAGYIAAKDGSQ